jgi:hypothetical protein
MGIARREGEGEGGRKPRWRDLKIVMMARCCSMIESRNRKFDNK